jgi:hypothetical protein
MRKQLLLLGVTALLLVLAAPLVAAPKAQGPEIRVSSAPTTERHPVAAFDRVGNSLVVWEDEIAGLVGRLFGPDGTARGDSFVLVANQRPAALPYSANVAIAKGAVVAFLPSGRFLLLWTEETDFEQSAIFITNDQLLDHEVFGRLFSASGQPVGDRFRVHDNAAGFQNGARLLVRGNDVVAVWQNSRNPLFPTNGAADGVFVRTFDFTGHATSAEVRVSPAGTRSGTPAIAGGTQGRFLIAYEGGDGDGRGIFAQPYTAALAPIGSPVRVNTGTVLDQRRPAAAGDASGNYLVLWQSQFQDVKHARIFGQQVGAAGNLIGHEIAVSHGASQNEVAPSVAAGPSGFLAVWLGYGETFPTGILASAIDRATGNVGAALQVNQTFLGANTQSAVAASATGAFLVPFESFVGDDAGISARRLSN